MRKTKEKPKLTFADIWHLAHLFCEQYDERKLHLSEEQEEASFRDFVRQYACALYWDSPINLEIDPEAPLNTKKYPLANLWVSNQRKK